MDSNLTADAYMFMEMRNRLAETIGVAKQYKELWENERQAHFETKRKLNRLENLNKGIINTNSNKEVKIISNNNNRKRGITRNVK